MISIYWRESPCFKMKIKSFCQKILMAILFQLGLGYIFGQDQPNIILLFVDDLGWSDLGYRNTKFRTPHIDRLRAEGFDFTRAYISTPTCSPSRASLLTGKEPVRIQMVRHISGGPESEYNVWPTDPKQLPSRNWLPLEEITYAERLSEFGYYNQFIGKWHLGHEPYHPIHQGFHAQYGTGNHGHPGSYFAPFFQEGNPLPEIEEGAYLTDELTSHAESFLKGYERSQPFMLSLWYYNVHRPHMGRKDLLEAYKKSGLSENEIEYAAMVGAVDESVGRVREALEERGFTDKTVIIFLSDQGGYFTNQPFRGGKRGGETLCEGGARVPLIIFHPDLPSRQSTSDIPVQSLDLYPTLVELGSGKKCREKQINGRSLVPILREKKFPRRDLFFFRSYEDQYAAVIYGDWKLIKYRSGKFELYNLHSDVSETLNLSGQGLKIEMKLRRRLATWEEEVTANHHY